MDDNACETGVEGHLHSLLTTQQWRQLSREAEPKRLVWTAHLIGKSGCMMCAQDLMVQVGNSDEALMELTRIAYAAALMLESPRTQRDGKPCPLDEDAVRQEIEGASRLKRWGMAAEALSELAHNLPKTTAVRERWKAEEAVELARATIFHRTSE